MSISAAHNLDGKVLAGGWTVLGKLPKAASSGGTFSVGYIVKGPKQEDGFLKALDIAAAMGSGDMVSALREMTAAFEFERDLVEKCRLNRMKKVVLPFTSGQVAVDQTPLGMVPYIIFEKATNSVRGLLDDFNDFELAWIFRSLHNTAVGMMELHGNKITHQDLKPSNVLVFEDDIEDICKIGDLGRASDANKKGPFDIQVAGDQRYVPFDLFYQMGDLSDFDRKRSTDLYLLGSMIFNLFCGSPITFAIAAKVERKNITNVFAESLPFIEQAFSDVMNDFEAVLLKKAGKLSSEVLELVKKLCDPDPRQRGEKNLIGTSISQYNLQRCVSKLDLLSGKAEFELKRVL